MATIRSKKDRQPAPTRSRREVMTLGVAAAAGAVAGAMLPTPSAEAHVGDADLLHLGHANTGTASLTDSADAVLEVENTKAGAPALAVKGTSADDAAISGTSENDNGIEGFSTNAVGVFGTGPTGVKGFSAGGQAVQGDSDTGFGVAGTSMSGRGVVGVSESGVGVLGRAPGEAPGVFAVSAVGVPPLPDRGLALDVLGKSRFSTTGSGVIQRRRRASATVQDDAVSPASHVMVTLTGSPGSGVAVSWVDVGAGQFTVYLSTAPRANTPFTYFVVN